MDAKLQQEFASLPDDAKAYLTSDAMKANCKQVYDKAGGQPLDRDTVTKIRESFTAFVMPQVSEETRAKLSAGLTQEQKDAVWNKLSEGKGSLDLPGFVKLTTGIYTHALANGVQLENLQKYSNEWREQFSL